MDVRSREEFKRGKDNEYQKNRKFKKKKGMNIRKT